MTTEVTQGMFYEVMGYQAYDGYSASAGSGDDYPAYYLNWHMFAAFANAVTNQHNAENGTALSECYSCSGSGISVTCSEAINPYQCTGYRLPTEGEWEYGARSGTTSDFWTGNGSSLGGTYSVNSCSPSVTIQDGVSNPLLSDYAWFCGNAGGLSQEVAQKLPNDFGLYDMQGNLREWTTNWYGCSYPTSSTDPYCSASSTTRAVRGGYWNHNPVNLLVSDRGQRTPTIRQNDSGGRLVRTVISLSYAADVDYSSANCTSCHSGQMSSLSTLLSVQTGSYSGSSSGASTAYWISSGSNAQIPISSTISGTQSR